MAHSKVLKLVTVIGARPQMIKAAAISRSIRSHFSENVSETIVHTGQHYDPNMSQVFFDELGIPKEKYNLETGPGSHAVQTAKMMISIENVLLTEKPDALLLYGDTNSTLAACLVASKLFIPIIHVEAGVRFYNKLYPEEVNRIICDHLSALLFVPSAAGVKSLEEENIRNHVSDHQTADYNKQGVFFTGDIMYDNTLHFAGIAKSKAEEIAAKYSLPESFLLLTMHRPSNVDSKESLQGILGAMSSIAEIHGRNIVFPIHPRTQAIVESDPGLTEFVSSSRIQLIPPVSFIEMIHLESTASLIVTDSGGVQKEAYFLEKPCIIMLDETPWTELIDSGTAILTGNDPAKIRAAYETLSNKQLSFNRGLYGDGKAADFIVSKIIEHLNTTAHA